MFSWFRRRKQRKIDLYWLRFRWQWYYIGMLHAYKFPEYVKKNFSG